MAEALRSALEVSERPASSYYEMSDRAEGQPTLNRQEEGGGGCGHSSRTTAGTAAATSNIKTCNA